MEFLLMFLSLVGLRAPPLGTRKEFSTPVRRDLDLDMGLLNSTYKLRDFPLGPFWFSLSYGGNGSSSCLLVFDKTCGLWSTFDRDRLLIGHKGRTMVDIISEDGSYETVCVGDTTKDETCKYVIYIPIRKISNIRPDDSAVISGLVIGGNLSNGRVFSIKDMEEAFPNTDPKIFHQNEACYKM